MRRVLMSATLLCLLAGWLRADDAIVDTAALLHDLTDLDQLATFPSPPYVTSQASSYDRAAQSPQDPENWFANHDWGQYLRWENHAGRREQVMMDARGPGAIVRLWSANPRGTIRIYLDDDPRPVIETAMQDLLSGRFRGVSSPIAAEAGQGFNCYLPIAYAKSCKVTAEDDRHEIYYHVDFRTYPPDVTVHTFTLVELTKNQSALQAATQRLVANAAAHGASREVVLAPGETKVVASMSNGASAVRGLAVQVDPNRSVLEAMLRGVSMEMTFDGERTVNTPLGDFFGSAPGINAFQTLPLSVAADGVMQSRWVMPFEKSAMISLTNHTGTLASFSWQCEVSPFTWNERSMHFHADYHGVYDQPTQPRLDWNYLAARGKGVFAGVSLALDNPVRQWWGEGDEKIYVDGESFPSWFGTGSEDYFAYAWGSVQKYSQPFHSQSRCDGPDNYGRTSVNRFHIIDRVPFEKTFRFDMELWHWRQCKVNQSVTTYWYGLPGAVSDTPPLRPEQLVVHSMPPFQPQHVPGVIEGESMSILERTGHVTTQTWGDASGDEQLWWHHQPRVDDRLVLGFPIDAAGRYAIKGRFLKAPDYGIDQLAINGVPAGGPIDFYQQTPAYTEERDLGAFDLKAGENQFIVTVTGSNPKANKQYMFAIDYLRATRIAKAAATQPTQSLIESAESNLVSARQFRRIYNPAISRSQPWYVNDHCFVLDTNGRWNLFGITHAEPAAPLEEQNFAHATARSLLQSQWDTRPFALHADLPNWNETHLWAPSIVQHDHIYYLFYCAGDADFTRYKIHLATSKDLVDWLRSDENPMVVDGYQARDPMVLRIGSHWVMYYTATSQPAGGQHVVKAVTSDDLIHWSDSRTVLTAPQSGTIAGPCESPFVVRRGKCFYLFTGPWDDYLGTRVFRSEDPFQFDARNPISRIDAHAAEVVRDLDGSWYVSSAGWGQGGVYLAKLDWNDGLDDSDTSMPILQSASTSAGRR